MKKGVVRRISPSLDRAIKEIQDYYEKKYKIKPPYTGASDKLAREWNKRRKRKRK